LILTHRKEVKNSGILRFLGKIGSVEKVKCEFAIFIWGAGGGFACKNSKSSKTDFQQSR